MTPEEKWALFFTVVFTAGCVAFAAAISFVAIVLWP